MFNSKCIPTLYLFILATIGTLNRAIAQCNCTERKTNRIVVKQCPPNLISGDDNYQVALSIQEVNNKKFVLMTIRFRYFASTVGSNLQLTNDSRHVLELKLTKSEKDYIGQSEICHAQFEINSFDEKHLTSSSISSIRFKYNGEYTYRTFTAKQNQDVLNKHIECLNED